MKRKGRYFRPGNSSPDVVFGRLSELLGEPAQRLKSDHHWAQRRRDKRKRDRRRDTR